MDDFHTPKIARLICECGKEIYFDIPSGKYLHVGEKNTQDKTKKWTNEYVPGQEKPKVIYSADDPNASWNQPK